MNSVPITRSGTERSRFISIRIGCWIHGGEMLRAQARPNGIARITASPVPHNAICTVSHIWAT